MQGVACITKGHLSLGYPIALHHNCLWSIVACIFLWFARSLVRIESPTTHRPRAYPLQHQLNQNLCFLFRNLVGYVMPMDRLSMLLIGHPVYTFALSVHHHHQWSGCLYKLLSLLLHLMHTQFVQLTMCDLLVAFWCPSPSIMSIFSKHHGYCCATLSDRKHRHLCIHFDVVLTLLCSMNWWLCCTIFIALSV